MGEGGDPDINVESWGSLGGGGGVEVEVEVERSLESSGSYRNLSYLIFHSIYAVSAVEQAMVSSTGMLSYHYT